MTGLSAIGHAPSFCGIDVLCIQPKGQEAKFLVAMGEDTFERTMLPEISNTADLEGPYGHPLSGRALKPIPGAEPAQDTIGKLMELFSNNPEAANTLSVLLTDEASCSIVHEMVNNFLQENLTDVAAGEIAGQLAQGAANKAAKAADIVSDDTFIDTVKDILGNILGLS